MVSRSNRKYKFPPSSWKNNKQAARNTIRRKFRVFIRGGNPPRSGNPSAYSADFQYPILRGKGRENVPLEREERHSSRIIKQNSWCLAVIVRGTSWIDNSRRGKYGRFSKGSNPTFKQQVKILFHPLCRGIFPSRIYYRIVFLFTITYEKGKMR